MGQLFLLECVRSGSKVRCGKISNSLKMGQTRVSLGAAFGATLYRNLVLFCAIQCESLILVSVT